MPDVKNFISRTRLFTLPHNAPVMQYLQRLRDEAHRFAIGAHRQQRKIAAERSPLDQIPGIGAKRKKLLLSHFGSPGRLHAPAFPISCR